MEQMPHHREGIQNDLDKAYDEGHRDNELFTNQKLEEEKQSHLSKEEQAMVSREEIQLSPELADAVARLRDEGYLDTLFEGKEVHRLEVRPLSKEQAFKEYEGVGGEMVNHVEEEMPYIEPNIETLDVMMMHFGKDMKGDDALAEMERLGVRPLTGAELIQFGVANPGYEKGKYIIALGTKYTSDYYSGLVYAPLLRSDHGRNVHKPSKRQFGSSHWDKKGGEIIYFPVVLK